MNRSALKSLGILLLGVVAGCAIGPPWWGSSAGAGSGRLPSAGAQSEAGIVHGRGPAGSGGEASTRNVRGKPSTERLEMLAASLRQKIRYEKTDMAVYAGVFTEAAGLAAEEFGPLMTLFGNNLTDRRAKELLAARWAVVDPKAAMAFALERSELKDSGSIMSCIVVELAKVDLPAAKAAVKQLAHGEQEDPGRVLMHVIQEKDPRAALAYARELKDEEGEVEVLKRMAKNDPMAAAAELTPGRRDQEAAAEKIAATLLNRDRKKFEAWAESLVDSGQRVAARRQALAEDSLTNPKGAALAAASWLAAEPDAAAQSGDLPERITHRWLTENKTPPAEVAAWAAALPAGLFKEMAVSTVGAWWPAEDTIGASAWLASLPAGQGRDSAVQNLVRRINSESPADAFEWARTVGNPSLRYQTLMSTLLGWAEKDSAEAQAAVETLPAGDRGYLLEALQEQEKAKAKGRK